MSAKHLFLMFTNAVEGRDEDFNQWYDERHVPEVLDQVPGFLAATRYRLDPAQREGQPPAPYEYLVVYECEEDPQVVHDFLAATAGTRPWTDALADAGVGYVYTLISERRTVEEVRGVAEAP